MDGVTEEVDIDMKTVLAQIENLCKNLMSESHHYVLMTFIPNKTFQYFGSPHAVKFIEENTSMVQNFIKHCYNADTLVIEKQKSITVFKDKNTVNEEFVNVIDFEKCDMENEIDSKESIDNIVEFLGKNQHKAMEYVDKTKNEAAKLVNTEMDKKADVDDNCGDSDGTVDYSDHVKSDDEEGAGDESSGDKSMQIEFQCQQCSKTFYTEELLQNHRKEHSMLDSLDKDDNTCPICSKVYSSRKNLKRHFKSHNSINYYQCNICDKRFKNVEIYQSHLKSHKNPKSSSIDEESDQEEQSKWKCEKCKHTFDKEILLKNHMVEHDIFDKLKNNTCPVCGKVLSNRRILKRHYRIHTKVKLYECNTCGKTFTRSDVYKNHVAAHEDPKFKCSKCQRAYHSNSSLSKHTKLCTAECHLECKTCNIVFTDKENFEMHVCHSSEPDNLNRTYESGVTDDGRHICGICQKVFNRRKGLLNHRKLHSALFRNNFCHICNKNFNTKDILKKHERTVHEESRNFVCDSCGKGFKRADGLKQHLKTHNPEDREKIECYVCGRLLSSRKALDIHMRIHEDIVPFVCEACGKSFRQQSNLRSHILNVHTDEATFQCEKCPKKLKSLALWKVHMRFHACKEGLDKSKTLSLGKFYTCSFCPKTFATATQHKTHLRTHSNERPFGCTLCSKFFKERSKLKRHLTSVHSEMMHIVQAYSDK